MSILQLSPVKIGQSGVQPSSYKMLSNESLSAITTAGYIKQGQSGQFFNKNDLIECVYNYGLSNATNVQLYVTIDSNGVITLNDQLPGGLGQAALKSVSNNALPSVASVSGSTVVGHAAVFADTAGTVEDGGVLGTAASKAATDATKSDVASVNGTFIVGRLLIASDVAGTISDGGLTLKTIKNAAVAGGSPTFTVTDVFCDTSTAISVEFKTQTNPASILTVVPGAGTFDVTASADPGASTIMYSLIK